MGRRTSASARPTNAPTARAEFFATARARSGSNLAASSSFTTARASCSPSFAVGVTASCASDEDNPPPPPLEMENALWTASFKRVRLRARYSASNGWIARKVRIVSGDCCASV